MLKATALLLASSQASMPEARLGCINDHLVGEKICSCRNSLTILKFCPQPVSGSTQQAFQSQVSHEDVKAHQFYLMSTFRGDLSALEHGIEVS